MQRKIKVLVVKPNKLPEIQIIDNNDKTKKKIVGGNLSYVYDDNFNNIVFICNGNNNEPVNRFINNKLITGTFMIVRDDYEFGEDRSLTEKQIIKYQEFFNEKSIFDTNMNVAYKKVKEKDLAI